MAKPLSEDLPTRVIGAVEEGMSRRAAAQRFGISVASAVRFVKEWQGSGNTKKPSGKATTSASSALKSTMRRSLCDRGQAGDAQSRADALWDRFYTAAPPRRRQSAEQYK